MNQNSPEIGFDELVKLWIEFIEYGLTYEVVNYLLKEVVLRTVNLHVGTIQQRGFTIEVNSLMTRLEKVGRRNFDAYQRVEKTDLYHRNSRSIRELEVKLKWICAIAQVIIDPMKLWEVTARVGLRGIWSFDDYDQDTLVRLAEELGERCSERGVILMANPNFP